MSYSEIQIECLVKTNPKEIVKILTSPYTDVHTLTFGIEVLADEFHDEEIVLPIIKKLLRHINAMVRESALIAVNSFYGENKPPQDILDRIVFIAKNDPSSLLKDFATSALEDFGEK